MASPVVIAATAKHTGTVSNLSFIKIETFIKLNFVVHLFAWVGRHRVSCIVKILFVPSNMQILFC